MLPRLAGGFRIVEVPIVFRERITGKSKMSRQIVLEGVAWVTKKGSESSRADCGKSVVAYSHQAVDNCGPMVTALMV